MKRRRNKQEGGVGGFSCLLFTFLPSPFLTRFRPHLHFSLLCLPLLIQHWTSNMGENANQKWEWHNNEIGVGYAAPGVVRQRQAGYETSKIIDMSKRDPPADNENIKETATTDTISTKESKSKKADKSKKKRKRHREEHEQQHRASEGPSFNPFLQIFAAQISDTTRHFSVD